MYILSFHVETNLSLDSFFYEIIPKALPPGVEILTKRVPFQYFVCLHKSAVLLHEQLENRENTSLRIPAIPCATPAFPKMDLSIVSMSLLLDLPRHLHISGVLKLAIQTRREI
jgi:hypothetical protein